MTTPSYTTDLTTLATGDLVVDAGTWDESSDAGWDDAGSMVDDQNLYYNNTECVSAQFTKTGVGTIIYGHGTGITIPTDGAILMWHMWAAPPALASKANGGIRILVGDGFGAFEGWIVSGNDYPPEFIWNNHAIDPNIGSPDYTVGSPAAYSYFGTAVNATAQARGNPNAMNAIRYGRCEQIYTYGESADYAIFSGYAAVDNASTAKYALLRNISGGYLFQGLMSFGQTSTVVDFRDSNVSISIADTENVSANFNKIEINNASSNVEWTNINFTALGTVSKGSLEMIDDATFIDIGGVFTDMNTFIYDSNYTGTGRTWRRCGQVTQGGGTFTDCDFDKSSAAVSLLVDTLSLVTGCTFNSDGSNHAVNLGTIAATATISWDNTAVDYAAYNVAGSSTGNEVILVSVSSGQTLTVNVQSGATTPSFYNTGTGDVDIVAGAVDLVVSAIKSDGTEVDDVSIAVYAKDGTGDLPYQDSVTVSNSGTTATITHTAHGMKTGDKVLIQGGDQYYNRGVFTVTVTTVNAYTYTMSGTPSGNPTGCTSTWCAMYVVTSGTNSATVGRTFANDQPVAGFVRKSTTTPFYKTAPVSGTIDKSLGLNLIGLMLLDE